MQIKHSLGMEAQKEHSYFCSGENTSE